MKNPMHREEDYLMSERSLDTFIINEAAKVGNDVAVVLFVIALALLLFIFSDSSFYFYKSLFLQHLCHYVSVLTVTVGPYGAGYSGGYECQSDFLVLECEPHRVGLRAVVEKVSVPNGS